VPTTTPLSLMAAAVLLEPPGRLPRSVNAYVGAETPAFATTLINSVAIDAHADRKMDVREFRKLKSALGRNIEYPYTRKHRILIGGTSGNQLVTGMPIVKSTL
jgi:hypothetical protein